MEIHPLSIVSKKYSLKGKFNIDFVVFVVA